MRTNMEYDDLNNKQQNLSNDEWKEVATWLYSILDDIDTVGDVVKGNNSEYRNLVEKLHGLKRVVGKSDDGQTILFYPPSQEYGLTRIWHPCK